MPYLDEQGLDTLVKEIKDYALQKTSAEYSKEFSFAENDYKDVVVEVELKTDEPCLISIDIDSAQGYENYTLPLHGHLTFCKDLTGSFTGVASDDQDGNFSNSIKYAYSNEYLKIYILNPSGFLRTTNMGLHIKGTNVNSVDTYKTDAPNIGSLLSVENTLKDKLDDITNRVSTLETAAGTPTKYTADRVLVTDPSGYITNSNNITTTELNYLNGISSSVTNTSHLTAGTLGVVRGGTGKNTHTSNSVLVGNGGSTVKNIASASGALYATSSKGEPKFGTLPVAQGGTGSSEFHYSGILVADEFTSDYDGSSTPIISTIDIPSNPRSGALHYEEGVVMPFFSTLPVSCGGTGATNRNSARNKLGILSQSRTYIVSPGVNSHYALDFNTSIQWANSSIKAIQNTHNVDVYASEFYNVCIHTRVEGTQIHIYIRNNSSSTLKISPHILYLLD